MAQQLILEEELASIYTEKAFLQLPENYRLAIVRYGPYATSVLFPLALIGALSGPALSMLPNLTLHLETGIGLLFLLVSLLTGITALPGLFLRTRSSWSRLYWAGMLYVLSAIVSMDLGGLLLTFVIGFYLLFQIRPYYVR